MLKVKKQKTEEAIEAPLTKKDLIDLGFEIIKYKVPNQFVGIDRFSKMDFALKEINNPMGEFNQKDALLIRFDDKGRFILDQFYSVRFYTKKDVLDLLNAFTKQKKTRIMKESERLKQEANKEENDFAFMSKMNKSIRQAKLENFEEHFALKLEKNNCILTEFDGKKIIIDTQTELFGIIDFFPKANKVCIRKGNTWKSMGLRWMRENLLKNKQS